MSTEDCIRKIFDLALLLFSLFCKRNFATLEFTLNLLTHKPSTTIPNKNEENVKIRAFELVFVIFERFGKNKLKYLQFLSVKMFVC